MYLNLVWHTQMIIKYFMRVRTLLNTIIIVQFCCMDYNSAILLRVISHL